MNDDDRFINAIVFILIGIIAFLVVTIALMIPVANVFIAHAIFGGD